MIEEVEELVADEEEGEELGVKVQGVVNGSRWKTSRAGVTCSVIAMGMSLAQCGANLKICPHRRRR